ncbi:hypothetical protein LJR084_004415 [Variovorax sp. LjRoot84]|uniref:hypothetical protein n=1 Tax=Variovorax sp. LjRoot84 TaxID=3342340 RepID=UPI003ECF5B82
MTKNEVTQSLASIASDQHLADLGDDLVQSWLSANVGVAAVEPVLRFMEAHSDWDLGTPGPLVHFVERFHGQGYEGELIASVERKPTAHTLWMLNRLINGERDGQRKARLLGLLSAAATAPNAEPEAVDAAREFHAFQVSAN